MCVCHINLTFNSTVTFTAHSLSTVSARTDLRPAFPTRAHCTLHFELFNISYSYLKAMLHTVERDKSEAREIPAAAKAITLL